MACPLYLKMDDGSFRAYVRYREGEPLTIRLWGPREKDEPQPPCVQCGEPIGVGQMSTLIPVRCTDPARDPASWGNWAADDVHHGCLDAYLRDKGWVRTDDTPTLEDV